MGFSALKCLIAVKQTNKKGSNLRQSLHLADYCENKNKMSLYRVELDKCKHSINVPYLRYATKYVAALDNAKV